MTGRVRQHDTPLGEATGDIWRYVCPDCGSPSVIRRRSFDDGTKGRPADGRFYCEACKRSLDFVYDKRRGVEVRNV